MIPAPTPALTGLSVLVTRPADQGVSLCRQIEALGGEAIAVPAVVIEPLAEPVLISDATPGPRGYEVVIFVSRNAVVHGLKAVARTPESLLAAIGKATAAALVAAGVAPAIVPDAGFTSEALLAHPGLQAESIKRVLIVRGGAGRELLQDTLTARGIEVDCLEVYRRVPPVVDPAERTALETRWHDDGVGIVTATSGEILHNLHQMLTDAGRAALIATPLLTVSHRIATAARELGWRAEILVAPAADDDTLVGVLATWRTRARLPR